MWSQWFQISHTDLRLCLSTKGEMSMRFKGSGSAAWPMPHTLTGGMPGCSKRRVFQIVTAAVEGYRQKGESSLEQLNKLPSWCDRWVWWSQSDGEIHRGERCPQDFTEEKQYSTAQIYTSNVTFTDLGQGIPILNQFSKRTGVRISTKTFGETTKLLTEVKKRLA